MLQYLVFPVERMFEAFIDIQDDMQFKRLRCCFEINMYGEGINICRLTKVGKIDIPLQLPSLTLQLEPT